MGMYTELNVSRNLKLDRNTMEILKVMVGEREMGADIELPDYSLFKTRSQRWDFMLMSESFYFDHTIGSDLVNKMSWAEEDNMERILNVRCDLKNYDDEIELFLKWIYNYATTRGFVGYMRYEEDSDPTLIYFTDKGVKYITVDKKIRNFRGELV